MSEPGFLRGRTGDVPRDRAALEPGALSRLRSMTQLHWTGAAFPPR